MQRGLFFVFLVAMSAGQCPSTVAPGPMESCLGVQFQIQNSTDAIQTLMTMNKTRLESLGITQLSASADGFTVSTTPGPPEFPIPEKVQDIVQIFTVTATVLGVVETSPGTPMQVARSITLFSMAQCYWDHYKPLPFPEAVLPGVGISVPLGRFYRGAVLFNPISFLSFVAVSYAVALALSVRMSRSKKRNEDEKASLMKRIRGQMPKKSKFEKSVELSPKERAFAFCKWPGCAVGIFGAAFPGTVSSSISAIIHGADRPVDITLSIIALIALGCFILSAGFFVYAKIARGKTVVVEDLSIPDSKKEQEIELLSPGVSSAEMVAKTSCDDQNNSAFFYFEQNSPSAIERPCVVKVVKGVGAWLPQCRDASVFAGGYSMLFAKYHPRAFWFLLADVIFTILLSILYGIRPPDLPTCRLILILAAVLCCFILIVVVSFRPYVAAGKNVLLIIATSLAAVSSIISAVGAHRETSSNLIELSQTFAILATCVSSSTFFFTCISVLDTWYAGRIRKRHEAQLHEQLLEMMEQKQSKNQTEEVQMTATTNVHPTGTATVEEFDLGDILDGFTRNSSLDDDEMRDL